MWGLIELSTHISCRLIFLYISSLVLCFTHSLVCQLSLNVNFLWYEQHTLDNSFSNFKPFMKAYHLSRPNIEVYHVIGLDVVHDAMNLTFNFYKTQQCILCRFNLTQLYLCVGKSPQHRTE